MNIIKSVLAAFLLFLYSGVIAQSQVDAMKLLEMKQYNKAKSEFLKKLNEGNSANDLFYLGKIYSQQHKPDSAKIFFSKILSADPKSQLASIAQAIMEISSGNGSQAITILDKASRIAVSTKDVNTLVEIAITRYQAGDTAGWVLPMTLATTFDGKSTRPYIEAGKIYQSLGEKHKKQNYFFGLASGRFEQALYNDPRNLEALTAQAGIFTFGGNYMEATEYLNRVMSIDSNYIPALSLYGELSYTLGKYDKASLFYKRYMALAEYSEKELSRFITILYFNKEYAEANQQITPVLLKDPANAVMLRLKGYTAYELGKYPEGLDAMKKFFDLRTSSDTNKIIPSDYEYIGRLYSRTGNDSLAVLSLNKAVEADISRNGLYEEIARVYEKQKKYLQAIDFYNKFIEARNGDVAPAIFFSIGKDLLLVVKDVTATADSVNKTIYLQRADAAFGKVIVLSPDSHLGYLWHARVLAALDPETTLGLAKSDYEKALTIIEQKSDLAKYKSDLIEGYRYLGYFYYLQYDAAKEIKDVNAASQAKTDALKYWQKVLDIEPDNDIARQAIGAIK